jgi:7-cyano-7-deazaguanine synthase in queuosine biosynthesis
MIPFKANFHRVGEPHRFDLVSGKDFNLDLSMFSELLSGSLAPAFSDFLRIAVSVYVADRLLRRRCKCHPGNYRREVDITVEVSEPSFWSDGLLERVSESLNFVSGDAWNLSVTKLNQSFDKEQQLQFSFPLPSNARVCLYSGGLDSAAGLALQLNEDPNRMTIPVTVWHQGGQRGSIRRQLKLLADKFPRSEIKPFVVKANVFDSARTNGKEESSQRTRSLLFCAVGAAVASLVGVSVVEMYESGIGAINIPLLAGLTGAKTTRSSHPEFLRQMTEIVSLIAQRPIAFHLPFAKQTKAQVVSVLKSLCLEDLAAATASCSSFPLREKGAKQCGYCSACIFRRQALLSAGISEPVGTYKVDLFLSNHYLKYKKSTHYLKAFLIQQSELRKLKCGYDTPAFVLNHLHGTGVIQEGESSQGIVELLKRYSDEWDRVIADARRTGIAWTRFVGTEPISMQGVRHVSA